jgi:hypothetical protein
MSESGQPSSSPSAAADAASTPSDGAHAQPAADVPAAEAGHQGSDTLADVVLNPDAHGYDGHVALALDADMLSDIDVALDVLAHSHHLFDVPALDLGCGHDDTLPA